MKYNLMNTEKQQYCEVILLLLLLLYCNDKAKFYSSLQCHMTLQKSPNLMIGYLVIVSYYWFSIINYDCYYQCWTLFVLLNTFVETMVHFSGFYYKETVFIWNEKYTEQNYTRNTFVFAPIFHELNSKIKYFFYVHKRPISLKYCSQICLNLC